MEHATQEEEKDDSLSNGARGGAQQYYSGSRLISLFKTASE